MSTTYKDYRRDLAIALRLLKKTKDKETKITAAAMNWETRLAQNVIACIREEVSQ